MTLNAIFSVMCLYPLFTGGVGVRHGGQIRIRTQIEDFQGFLGRVMCVERLQIMNMYFKLMLEEIVKLKNECGFS